MLLISTVERFLSKEVKSHLTADFVASLRTALTTKPYLQI
jgi:hypothetical protein